MAGEAVVEVSKVLSHRCLARAATRWAAYVQSHRTVLGEHGIAKISDVRDLDRADIVTSPCLRYHRGQLPVIVMGL